MTLTASLSNTAMANELQMLQVYLPNLRENYSLAGQVVECIKEHPYLGIILDQQMSFTSHIKHIVAKASKVNFL